MKKELFNQYRARLVREGVLKSLMYGVMGGLAIIFAVSLVSWFFGFKGLWLALGVGVGVGVVFGAVLYFSTFRPTEKEIARRIDGLGLDERMITMMEFEKDDSYIARRQREDAREKLATVNSKDLTFSFTKKVVAWAIALAIASPAMAVVSELAAKDILKSGLDIVDPPAGPTWVEVSYVVEEGGEIEGEADQVVLVGESTLPVVAVPEEGWAFVEWDDGFYDPYRESDTPTQSIVYTAIFEQIQEDDGSKGEGTPGEGMPMDGMGGMPMDFDMEGQKGEMPGPPDYDKPPQDGAGGDPEFGSQILDGNTPYEPYLPTYKEDAMNNISSNSDLSDLLRKIIQTYYETLE